MIVSLRVEAAAPTAAVSSEEAAGVASEIFGKLRAAGQDGEWECTDEVTYRVAASSLKRIIADTPGQRYLTRMKFIYRS